MRILGVRLLLHIGAVKATRFWATSLKSSGYLRACWQLAQRVHVGIWDIVGP